MVKKVALIVCLFIACFVKGFSAVDLTGTKAYATDTLKDSKALALEAAIYRKTIRVYDGQVKRLELISEVEFGVIIALGFFLVRKMRK